MPCERHQVGSQVARRSAVATSLATGSGFWGFETGVTMLYPSEPALLYAGLSYLYNAQHDIDKQIGRFHIGMVDRATRSAPPSDSASP